MSLDVVSIPMIEAHARGGAVLCLGYPEHPDKRDVVRWLGELGATRVDVVDVIQHFGMERLIDLNVEQVWPREYGLVINPGTVEHCFNVATAWSNAWRALVVGGYLVNVCPVSLLNHGYWNVNPVAIYDWCDANGGEVLELKFAINGRASTEVIPEKPGIARGRQRMPPEVVMYGLCRKTVAVPIRWPTQGQYR
jgi:hypothetical protein